MQGMIFFVLILMRSFSSAGVVSLRSLSTCSEKNISSPSSAIPEPDFSEAEKGLQAEKINAVVISMTGMAADPLREPGNQNRISRDI